MWKVELFNMTHASDNEKTVSEVLETKSFFCNFIAIPQFYVQFLCTILQKI